MSSYNCPHIIFLIFEMLMKMGKQNNIKCYFSLNSSYILHRFQGSYITETFVSILNHFRVNATFNMCCIKERFSWDSKFFVHPVFIQTKIPLTQSPIFTHGHEIIVNIQGSVEPFPVSIYFRIVLKSWPQGKGKQYTSLLLGKCRDEAGIIRLNFSTGFILGSHWFIDLSTSGDYRLCDRFCVQI